MPKKIGTYDVYGNLGKGNFGRVRFAVNRLTNFSYAIKIIDKAKLRTNGLLDQMKSEIAIMKMIDSKYCIGIRDMFVNPESVYLVVDLMMGGSLLQKFKKKGKLPESKVRSYVQQILRGVDYCHSNGIIIGGLSLEGILLDGEGALKISDFGCAVLEAETVLSSSASSTGSELAGIRKKKAGSVTRSGSPHYFAPEIVELNASVSRLTDIWSVGVINYALVAGYLPFDLKPTLTEMLQNITAARFEPYPDWFSAPLCDLLSKIFVQTAASRVDMDGLKEDAWLMWDDSTLPHIDPSDLDEGGGGGGAGDHAVPGTGAAAGSASSGTFTGAIHMKDDANVQFCSDSLFRSFDIFSMLCLPFQGFTENVPPTPPPPPPAAAAAAAPADSGHTRPPSSADKKKAPSPSGKSPLYHAGRPVDPAILQDEEESENVDDTRNQHQGGNETDS